MLHYIVDLHDHRARILALLAVLYGCNLLNASESGNDEVLSAFKTSVVELTVLPGTIDAPIEWNYTNNSESPLVVAGFDQSCGCLSGVLEPEVVTAGNSGVIRATFTPGPYRGTVRKSLYVRFLEHEEPVELVAEVTIPSTVELSTQELTWVDDKVLDSQVVDVKTGTGQDFAITKLLGVPEKFYGIRKEVVVEGRHYRLHILPDEQPPTAIQTLQIHTDSKDPRDRVLAVFLRRDSSSLKNMSSTGAISGQSR